METEKTSTSSPFQEASNNSSVDPNAKKYQEIILCLHGCELFRIDHDLPYCNQSPGQAKIDWLKLTEGVKNDLASHIDNLGQQSAHAQKLKTSITTYAKLMQNQDYEYLYFLIDQQSIPKGYIRICRKKLFLNEIDQLREYENCLCVMDFFVVERREGLGLKLMMTASKDLNLKPKDLLIDRPSNAMINFMKKHFNLKPLHHYNKFASFV